MISNFIFKKSDNIEHDKLIEVSYSNSGDSNGNIDKVILDVDKEIITTEYKAIHSDPLEVNIYRVSSKDIDKIISMVDKNNLISFSNLPIDTDLIAMDAPSKSLGLVYNNSNIGGAEKEWYSISYNSKFPKGGFELVKEVANYLVSLTKDEKRLIKSKKVKE